MLEPVRRSLAQAPYHATLGLVIDWAEPDRVRLRLPYRQDNGNRNGTLHGGVIASLIDVGAMLAVHAAPGADEAPATTIDLAVHYLAPVLREGVVADATVVRRGREIAFVEVAVTGERDVPIARGLVARRTLPPVGMEVGAANELPADIPWDRLESARGSGSPFTARIGVKVAPLGPGESIALLPAAASLTARDGRLHEGALAALVDCAGGAAAWSADGGFDPRGRAATVGMHLGYDVSPRDEDVVARAYTPWRAAGIFVHAVSLWGRRSGRPIASGSVTYRVERPG